jgi:hypothetical protein
MGNLNNISCPTTVNAFKLQKDQKFNSDTTFSMSPNDLNITTPIKPKEIKSDKLHQRIFNTNIAPNIRLNGLQNDMLPKKRKRYIKNNKFVFVHPGSAAAKKLEMEKVRKCLLIF